MPRGRKPQGQTTATMTYPPQTPPATTPAALQVPATSTPELTAVPAQEDTTSSEGQKRGNFYNYLRMKHLNRDMIVRPHWLDYAEMQSDEFALEKNARLIIEPLAFESEAEYLGFARKSYQLYLELDDRRADDEADDFIAGAEPKVLASVRRKLAAMPA